MRLVIEHNTDVVFTIVSHKPPTPPTSVSSLPRSKTPSFTMPLQTPGFCEQQHRLQYLFMPDVTILSLSTAAREGWRKSLSTAAGRV